MIQLLQLICSRPELTIKYATLPNADAPKLSTKTWASVFPDIRKIRGCQNPSSVDMDNLLGPLSPLAAYILATPCAEMDTAYAWVQKEGDCVRILNTHFTNVVMKGFQNMWPNVAERSETGPLGDSQNINQTIDWSLGHKSTTAHLIECKTHGIIDSERWLDPARRSNPNRMKLARELRGYDHSKSPSVSRSFQLTILLFSSRYCVKYRCPSVSCFDGYNLLSILFHARNAEEIASPECDTTILITDINQSTIREQLFRFMVMGIESAQIREYTIPLRVGDAERGFEWCTGRPFWKAQGFAPAWDHPLGHKREFDIQFGAYYWVGADGAALLGDGGRLFDTEALWE